MIIRDITPEDRAQWEILWQGYQEFYKIALSREVTDCTWRHFLAPDVPVHALVAVQNQKLLGLVHYIFHHNTWSTTGVCYLEDLFTLAEARGQGVGRGLIEAVYAKAKEHNMMRVYWMTQEGNKQARILYDQLAECSDFVQYRKNL